MSKKQEQEEPKFPQIKIQIVEETEPFTVIEKINSALSRAGANSATRQEFMENVTKVWGIEGFINECKKWVSVVDTRDKVKGKVNKYARHRG